MFTLYPARYALLLLSFLVAPDHLTSFLLLTLYSVDVSLLSPR